MTILEVFSPLSLGVRCNAHRKIYHLCKSHRYLPFIFLLSHFPLAVSATNSEGLIEIIEDMRDSEAALQFVTEALTVVVVIIVRLLFAPGDADMTGSAVKLLLPVQPFLARSHKKNSCSKVQNSGTWKVQSIDQINKNDLL